MSLAAVSSSQSSYPAPTVNKPSKPNYDDIHYGFREYPTMAQFVTKVLQSVKDHCASSKKSEAPVNVVQDKLHSLLEELRNERTCRYTRGFAWDPKKCLAEDVVSILERLAPSDLEKMESFQPPAGFSNVVLRTKSYRQLSEAEQLQGCGERWNKRAEVAKTAAHRNELDIAINALNGKSDSEKLELNTFVIAKELALKGNVQDALKLVDGVVDIKRQARPLLRLAKDLDAAQKPNEALQVLRNIPNTL